VRSSNVGPCGADSVKLVSTEWLGVLLSLYSYCYRMSIASPEAMKLLKTYERARIRRSNQHSQFFVDEKDAHVCTEVLVPLICCSKNNTIVLVVDIDSFRDVINLLEGEHAPCI